MSTRDDVVEVLDGLTVDLGPDREPAVIDARTHVPDAFSAYCAWPVWVATSFLTACILDETWTVLVALPGGVPDAWSVDGDALLMPIRDALSKIGGVSRVEPVTLAIGDATTVVPALAFTLNT